MIRYPGFEIFDLHENALMRSCVDPREAYIPCFPSYKRKKTLAGYVEICSVLKLVRYEPTDDGDVVYYYEMTDRHVAIKVCQVENMNSLQRTNKEDPMKEMSIMQLLGADLPNVGTCIEVLYVPNDGDDESCCHIILPFLGGGDLHGYVRSRSGPMTEDEAKAIFRDIMTGLNGLHERGICHHDLSPSNIMIHHGLAYIIDFGMALRVPSTRYGRSCLIKPDGAYGKLPYMAPEIYQSNVEYDPEAIDVWSAGIILWDMVSGLGSYHVPHVTDKVFKAMTEILPKCCQKWSVQLSDDCLDLLQKMIQVDDTMRFTIHEVLAHPWMRQ